MKCKICLDTLTREDRNKNRSDKLDGTCSSIACIRTMKKCVRYAKQAANRILAHYPKGYFNAQHQNRA